MPSWKTGILRRFRQSITWEEILNAILIAFYILMMIFMMVYPILLAIAAPPTAEFGGW
jgi:hypothetical protein